MLDRKRVIKIPNRLFAYTRNFIAINRSVGSIIVAEVTNGKKEYSDLGR